MEESVPGPSWAPRFLPNAIRETPSLPVRHVRTDVLLDQGHGVLPSPASKSSVRRSGGSQSRGRQPVRDGSVRGDGLEHRRSVARACSRRLPWLQPEPDGRIRRRGAPGRRNSLLRRRQDAAHVDIRRHRVVAALAVDGDRQTKLPQPACSSARHHEPHGVRAAALDRHRRIRVLREGRPSRLWSRVQRLSTARCSRREATIASFRSNDER